MNEPAAETLSLEVRRTIAAPREKIFAAWTDPEAIAKWHASGEYRTAVTEYDLREGGRYRYEFLHQPSGGVKPVWGEFREVKVPERLVYTWNLDNPEGPLRDTVVTVEFHDRGGQTEVVVRHEGFPTAEVRGMHDQGWNGCLDRIPTSFT